MWSQLSVHTTHDDVIEWKHYPRYWPVVRGIHRSPVDSPHKGQWRRALMISLICAWTNGWANKWDSDELRRHPARYDVPVIVNIVARARAYIWWGENGWIQLFFLCCSVVPRDLRDLDASLDRFKWWFAFKYKTSHQWTLGVNDLLIMYSIVRVM